MAQNGGLAQHDLLVVPRSPNVTERTLSALADYASNNDVVVMGEGSLQRNEYDQPLPADVRSSVFENVTTLPASIGLPELRSQAWQRLQGLDLTDVVVYDAETDEPLEHGEWRSATVDGEIVVNVANYSHHPRSIRIERGGSVLSEGRERVDRTPADGTTQEVPGFTPRLFTFDL
jgi:hypothetical protein